MNTKCLNHRTIHLTLYRCDRRNEVKSYTFASPLFTRKVLKSQLNNTPGGTAGRFIL